MSKILAIDLGKFKSVTCLLDTETIVALVWPIGFSNPIGCESLANLKAASTSSQGLGLMQTAFLEFLARTTRARIVAASLDAGRGR